MAKKTETPKKNTENHEFLTNKEAADFLRLKPATLDLYRCEGRGPEYRKHGARVMYSKAVLMAWSDGHRYKSTSQRIRKKQ